LTDLFGHPRGLSFLFATEMWERFSYYGMRALLVLYMVKYLLLGDSSGVIGMAETRAVLEWMFGPLGVQPLASQIYGFYTAFVYATPILGGYLADRWLGLRRTVVLGAMLMSAGHFMMAFESLFLLALTAIILANGCFKPNISTQVGALYAPGDPRRDRAYPIFYVGINIGAFFSPLVCGTLGEELGWHWGFSAAGVGMLCGLAIYLWGTRHLPRETLRVARAPKTPLSRGDWRAVIALVLLLVPTILSWAAYEQQGNTIALWAEDHTDRSIGPLTIPTTWFQSFNPFMIFAFTPFVVALWAAQARGGREPSTVAKLGLGYAGIAASYLVMAAAAFQAGGGNASWLWLLAFFVVITVGELYSSPIGLSLVTKVAPASILSTMMGLWLGAGFLGNFLAGWLGSFWSGMDKAEFFLMIAGVGGLAAVFTWALMPFVLRSIHESKPPQP
jgi:POT family proton-dependent oligopeptide transporter